MAATTVRRTRRTRRAPARAAFRSCGALLALLVLLLAARAAGLDAGTVLAVPMVLFPYASVLSALVLVAVLCVRALRGSRLLVAAAVLITAGYAVPLAPRFVPDGPDAPADAPVLRVATLNTHVGAAEAAAVVRLVRDERVDVLALQELTAPGIAALKAAGLDAVLPHHELHPENDSSLYSRLPLTGGGPLRADTAWPQTTARVAVGGRSVRLVAVHTYYPLGDAGRWTRDMAALASTARSSGPDTVFLGDFNASLDHAPMRDLLSTGRLADAHADLGRAWARTWPAGKGPLPPLVQLDHVLHGPGLATASVSERTVPGTDHRAVVAALALLPVEPHENQG
ncbi:endonuclease/exonuclease/phosphatase family protein [Streptomyces sp. NPDC001941]|uniref:endonuclease/exonuclease/phosphatase family protein n=1 Tax=Streptomyces sp. NPDC001941 TaxID=3154659 RepID=UPI0033303A69